MHNTFARETAKLLLTYLQLPAALRLSSRHLAFTFCLTISGLVIAWHCSAMLLPHLILQSDVCFDVWFDADSPMHYRLWTSRWSGWDQVFIFNHPFYRLLTTPPVWLATKVTNNALAPQYVAQVLLALVAAASTAVMYWLLLAITQSGWTSLLWTAIYLASSGFLLWCGIPESFWFGMLSMLLPLLVAAYLPSPGVSHRWIVAGLLVSLSITVTNVMSGIAAALATVGLRRTLAALKDFIVAIAVISFIQAQIIPATSGGGIFSSYLPAVLEWGLPFAKPDEHKPLWLRPYRVLFTGVVIPKVVVIDEPRRQRVDPRWAARGG